MALIIIIVFSFVIYETWSSSITFEYLLPECDYCGLRAILLQLQYAALLALFIHTLASEFSLPTINQASYEKLSKARNTNGIDNYNFIFHTSLFTRLRVHQ
jgi:hypothetical protein